MEFKVLKETRTITTLWAVPADARIEDLDTQVFYEYCLDQVTHGGIQVPLPKIQVQVNKTLELEEPTVEEQQNTTFQPDPLIPNPTNLDCVVETVEALLVRNQSEDNINNSLEQLELLKRWIDTRMLELI
jgi:hypothetical protein